MGTWTAGPDHRTAGIRDPGFGRGRLPEPGSEEPADRGSLAARRDRQAERSPGGSPPAVERRGRLCRRRGDDRLSERHGHLGRAGPDLPLPDALYALWQGDGREDPRRSLLLPEGRPARDPAPLGRDRQCGHRDPAKCGASRGGRLHHLPGEGDAVHRLPARALSRREHGCLDHQAGLDQGRADHQPAKIRLQLAARL